MFFHCDNILTVVRILVLDELLCALLDPSDLAVQTICDFLQSVLNLIYSHFVIHL